MAIAKLPPAPAYGPGFCPECGAEANPVAYRIGATTSYARACTACKHVEALDFSAARPPEVEVRPLEVVPSLTDEALHARCDALYAALHDVLRFCVDRGGFMKPKAQRALNVADALLVEGEGR